MGYEELVLCVGAPAGPVETGFVLDGVLKQGGSRF